MIPIAFILASASSRRKELLCRAGYYPVILPANVDETVPPGTAPDKAVCVLAMRKAAAIAIAHPYDTIVAADTIVAIDGELLGKPHDENEARAMLARLSGRTHQVYTGVCVYAKGASHRFCSRTDVTFYPLSDEEIDAYIATGEPFDKAGGYGIQEKGAVLVERIRGDFYNVVGLPIAPLVRLLRSLGV